MKLPRLCKTFGLASLTLASVGAGDAIAQGCAPAWSDAFTSGDIQGTVYATTVFDFDGPGPEAPSLVIGGDFLLASGVAVPRVARWTGTGWQAVGSASLVPSSRVRSFAIYDDGVTGPSLYMAGGFTAIGATPVGGLARWNGSAWVAPTTGVSAPGGAGLSVIAVFDDDGPGPRRPGLYVGGSFTTAGVVTARNIARWDGTTWQALGIGLGDNGTTVQALQEFDPDGPGPLPSVLYAGGNFSTAGGLSVTGVASWDGTAWAQAPSLTAGSVTAFAVFDEDDTGPGLPKLFLNSSVGSISVCRLDGNAWTTVGSSLSGNGWTLRATDSKAPGGAALYLGGTFTSFNGISSRGIVRWNGTSWSGFGSGTSIDGEVRAITVADPDGSGPLTSRVIAAGAFTTIGTAGANGIGAWDGATWSPFGNGMSGRVSAIASFDPDGSGPANPVVAIGGAFVSAGPTLVRGITTWNGTSFSSLGGGLAQTSTNVEVLAIASFDEDGAGPGAPNLVIGGVFATVGGVSASNIARWNGSTWAPMGAGFDGTVRALAVYDDGSGPTLFAGGSFHFSGLAGTNYIAKWDGFSWVVVPSPLTAKVNAMAVFDEDGAGPNPASLFVGSDFNAAYLSRVTGSTWTLVGAGIGGAVQAITVADLDGAGPLTPRLYVGGTFTTAGGIPASRLASWDGTTWRSVGQGVQNGVNAEVLALASFDDDGTSFNPVSLFVGGLFTQAGNQQIKGLARFDGADWFPLSSGLSDPVQINVRALAVVDQDGPGARLPALFSGGVFQRTGAYSSANFARWGCPVPVCYANCDGSTVAPVLTANDFSCFLIRFANGDPLANCDGSTVAPVLTANDFTCFLNSYSSGCP